MPGDTDVVEGAVALTEVGGKDGKKADDKPIVQWANPRLLALGFLLYYGSMVCPFAAFVSETQGLTLCQGLITALRNIPFGISFTCRLIRAYGAWELLTGPGAPPVLVMLANHSHGLLVSCRNTPSVIMKL
jgi:hypothetical protein